MTTRVQALTVALEQDWREDDVPALIACIAQLRGVLSVESIVADPGAWVARKRAQLELREKLISILEDERREA